MVEKVDEPVDVMAAFLGGRLVPRLFKWHGRRYAIKEVTSMWTDLEGQFRRYFYAVTTDAPNLYELVFSTKDLRWLLIKIYFD